MAKSKWDNIGIEVSPDDALNRARRVGSSEDMAKLLVETGKNNATPYDYALEEQCGFSVPVPSPFKEFRVVNSRLARDVFGIEPL